MNPVSKNNQKCRNCIKGPEFIKTKTTIKTTTNSFTSIPVVIKDDNLTTYNNGDEDEWTKINTNTKTTNKQESDNKQQESDNKQQEQEQEEINNATMTVTLRVNANDIELSMASLSITEITEKKPFAILKYFNEDRIRSVGTRAMLNGYILPGCLEALKKVIGSIPPEMRNTIFGLNMVYDLIPNIRNKTGDAQPFLTETVEISDESPHSAMIHGIREELRMFPSEHHCVEFIHQEQFPLSNKKMFSGKPKTLQTTNRKTSWYHTNIRNLSVCTDVQHPNKRPETKKGRKDKIACIVWGSLPEINHTLEQLPIYSKRCDSDGINGILCIRLDEMYQIIQTILHEGYKGLDKFYWYDNQKHKYAFHGQYCTESEKGTF